MKNSTKNTIIMSENNLHYANRLLNLLNNHYDDYSLELKSVLTKFISNTHLNLVSEIENIKALVPLGGYRELYDDFQITAILSEIFFP